MFLHITVSLSVQTRVIKMVQIPRGSLASCVQKLKWKFPYEASMLPRLLKYTNETTVHGHAGNLMRHFRCLWT